MCLERNLSICIEMDENGVTKVSIDESETGDYVSREFQYYGYDSLKDFSAWIADEIGGWIDTLNEEREEMKLCQ